MLQRDGFAWVVDSAQVVGAFGALIAIGFAAWSIVVAKRQAAESNEALIRERRIDFYLAGLRELGQAIRINPAPGRRTAEVQIADAQPRVAVAALLLPADLVPYTRACLHLPTTQAAEAEATRGGSRRYWHADIDRIQSEIDSAVERLLSMRSLG